MPLHKLIHLQPILLHFALTGKILKKLSGSMFEDKNLLILVGSTAFCKFQQQLITGMDGIVFQVIPSPDIFRGDIITPGN